MMKKYLSAIAKSLIYIFLLNVTFSCKPKVYKSEKAFIIGANVLESNMEGLEIDTVITFENEHSVFLLPNKAIDKSIDTLNLQLDFVVSDNAKSSSATQIEYSNPQDFHEVSVTAESGETKNWKVYFAGNQLAYNDFEDWYNKEYEGIKYREPGVGKNIFWNTSNFMSVKAGFEGIARFPEGGTKQAKIITGKSDRYPIFASALFNGIVIGDKSNLTPQNLTPEKVTGLPYSLKPKYLKLNYRYEPGEEYIQVTTNSNGNVTIEKVNAVDKCQIVALLVKRMGETIIEIGKAEMISAKFSATVQSISIPFEYKQKDLEPTHLIIFATSSYEGYMLKGAVGSFLIIDNIQLVL